MVLGRTASPKRAAESLASGKLPVAIALGTIRLKRGYAELRKPLAARLLDRRALPGSAPGGARSAPDGSATCG